MFKSIVYSVCIVIIILVLICCYFEFERLETYKSFTTEHVRRNQNEHENDVNSEHVANYTSNQDSAGPLGDISLKRIKKFQHQGVYIGGTDTPDVPGGRPEYPRYCSPIDSSRESSKDKCNGILFDYDVYNVDKSIYINEKNGMDIYSCSDFTVPPNTGNANEITFQQDSCKPFVKSISSNTSDEGTRKESVLDQFKRTVGKKISNNKTELDNRVEIDYNDATGKPYPINYPNRTKADEKIDARIITTQTSIDNVQTRLTALEDERDTAKSTFDGKKQDYYTGLKQCNDDKVITHTDSFQVCKENASLLTNQHTTFDDTRGFNRIDMGPSGCTYDSFENRLFINDKGISESMNIANRGNRYVPVCKT
jgi:hypothetical protein